MKRAFKTKCAQGCPRKLLCKRWTAPASTFSQSYANFKADPVSGICEYYWPNTVAQARYIEVDKILMDLGGQP